MHTIPYVVAAVGWLILSVGCGPADATPAPEDADRGSPLEEPSPSPLLLPDPESALRFHLDFENLPASAVNRVDGAPVTIHSPWHEVESAPGPVGKALRLDGYSVSVAPREGSFPSGGEALTVEAWVALEAWPTANAPFVGQYRFPDQGFFFGLDRLGRWYLALSIDGHWHTAWGEGTFPRDRWVHVAGTFHQDEGLRLYLDGKPAGSAETPSGRPYLPAHEEQAAIGWDPHGPHVAEIFPTGMLNGLLDEVRVYDRRLEAAEVASRVEGANPPEAELLALSSTRFAADIHRPRYHPMPPTAWTNEPHGLIRSGDEYHLFYQKNPNGPYWSHIHWGQMKTRDFVRWEHLPMALSPEPGFDEAGVWSGAAFMAEGRPAIMYTGVDGVRAGIGLAFGDGRMTAWTKDPASPVVPRTPEGYLDFRDPYVWREGETWRMLIGSGIPDQGGTALLYASSDLVNWQFQGPLLTMPTEVAGRFWEMPVLTPIGNGKHLFMVTTVELPQRPRGLYWIGTWDGARFIPDFTEPKQQDVNNGQLSPTVTTDVENRLVALGVVPEARSSQAQLRAGWAQAFNLPRILSLCEDGATLCQSPHPNLQQLRGAHRRWENLAMQPGQGTLDGLAGRQLEIELEIDPGDAREVGIRLLASPGGEEETVIRYRPADNALILDRSRSSTDPEAFGGVEMRVLDIDPGPTLHLRLFIDHSVIEGFVEDQRPFALRAYPAREESTNVDLFAEGGTARLLSLDAWELTPAD